MIKYQKYTFAEYPSSNHWITFANFGPVLSSEQGYASKWNDVDLGIKLDPEKSYQIGMDQSSSNTGIFIKDYNNTEAWMIEVARGKGQTAGDYIFDLEMLLHRIGEGNLFSHIIYEKPITSESYRSSQVAFQLEGMVDGLHRRYPEFKAARLDAIENASWRSVVIDKNLDPRYNRKEQSRESINKIFPWTLDYGNSLYKDNDIFEAIGVLMGWFFCSFDSLGRPYVRGTASTRTVGGFILPGLDTERVIEMLKEHDVTSELRVANPSYSIYKNLTHGVEPFKTTCVEFTEKYAMLALCIECNVKWLDPEVMTVILVDASTVDSKLKEITGGEFHFVV